VEFRKYYDGFIVVFLLYLRVLLSKARPNWFIGIRTPWTMSSPEVWRRTHRVGSVLFIILGGLSLVSVLFRPSGLILTLGLLLLSSLFLVLRPTEACSFA
jgi:uncharacterized membrane protein